VTERLRRAGQVCWALVGVAVLIAILGLVAWTVRVVFPPLILAGAIVFVLNPVVTWLHRHGIHRALGATASYVGVLGIITLAGVLIVPLATDQGRELKSDWPEIKAKTETWIDDVAADSKDTFWEFDAQELKDDIFGTNSNTPLRVQLQRAQRLGLRLFHILLILFLGPVIAFYLLVDLPHVRKVVEGLIPDPARDEVMVVSHRLNRAIGGFFRGQLLVALIVGTMCSIGLAIIGLRFWFLIGMLAGLFNIIPLIGPWIGGVPGVIIALTTGSPVQALLVVAIMAGAQQVDNHFITPQVMHRVVHLHPAVVILALLAGGTLGGFFGLLMAVPVTATLKIILSHVWRVHFLGQPMEPDPAVPVKGATIDVSPADEDVSEDEGEDEGEGAGEDYAGLRDDAAEPAPARSSTTSTTS
jgi:predicted PurR-regulated permease PerM